MEGENTWRGGELESAIAGDVNWASQKNLRLFFNLNLAQLGWLTVRGILLVQHLEGGAMPGWPLWMLEETRVLKKIDLLRNNGAIEELADGKLLTLHEIEILHRISPKAMIDLMLKDKIMCPLWDFEGNCGWPIGYVQWVSKNVGDST